MLYGDDPASCSRCGGALLDEAEQCPCGGRDYRCAPSRAAMSGDEAMARLLAKRYSSGEQPVSWTTAMAELRRKYVPPS